MIVFVDRIPSIIASLGYKLNVVDVIQFHVQNFTCFVLNRGQKLENHYHELLVDVVSVQTKVSFHSITHCSEVRDSELFFESHPEVPVQEPGVKMQLNCDWQLHEG